jgi:hypothetical protein
MALQVDPALARALLGPLHGVFNLRHADAHLPGSELDTALALLRIGVSLPLILRGCQLMHSCVSSLYPIAEVLKEMNDKDTSHE